MDEEHEDYQEVEFECWHTSVVSISEDDCQCMDCLRIWPKDEDFKSDWPAHDIG